MFTNSKYEHSSQVLYKVTLCVSTHVPGNWTIWAGSIYSIK